MVKLSRRLMVKSVMLRGRTCECNCHPACRRHHRCKGSAGWQLTMAEPGILAWRLPHGRTYVTHAEPYPI
jgi:hypothetical protein